MVSGLFHIRVNGNEDNKDNAFSTLLISGASVFCMRGEEYIVPEEVKKKLEDKKVDFEVVEKKEVITE